MGSVYHRQEALSMSIALYLAMTAADFSHCPLLPEPVAWMALPKG